MKSLVALSFIFLYTIVSLPISQSRIIYPNDENLIEQTCKQTPNYDLCVTSLNSDRHSATTDVRGLALIMVDVAKSKAVPTLNHINTLLNNSTGKEKQALSSCVGYYNTIIKADVPVAIDALMRRNYKFAEQYSTDAANEADSCEQAFSGSSPLTDMNKVMHDVAAIAAAIIRILISSLSQASVALYSIELPFSQLPSTCNSHLHFLHNKAGGLVST